MNKWRWLQSNEKKKIMSHCFSYQRFRFKTKTPFKIKTVFSSGIVPNVILNNEFTSLFFQRELRTDFWVRVLSSVLSFFLFFSGGKLWWVQDGHTQWHTQSHLRTLTYNAATRQPARHVIFLCFDFFTTPKRPSSEANKTWCLKQTRPTTYAKDTYSMSERDLQHERKRLST